MLGKGYLGVSGKKNWHTIRSGDLDFP